MALVLVTSGIAQDQQQRADTPLVVGSEEDYPPFATGKTDETAGGFTVDLWKAVAAEHALSYTIKVRPFRQILEEFKAGKIDVMINLAQSDERRAFADFSVPHVIVHGAIFVRKGDSRIQSEADFAGKSIIVIHADLAQDYAVSNGWGQQLMLVDNAAEGLKLLASGKHDAMLLSKLAGTQTLQEEKIRNVTALAAKAGFSQKFSFAVRKGNAELLAKVNEGLAVAKASGTYDALYEKWFGVFESSEIDLPQVKKYLGLFALGLALLGAILFARNHERKKVGQQLRDSEERLRLAMSAANQGLYDLNVQTGECIVTPEYALMLGYDPAEFRESNAAWLERLHPDDREATYEAYAKYVAGRRPEYRVEFRQRTKDGAWKWILSLGKIVARSADGRPLRMLGTHTDITERKLAEESLREREERLRAALSASGTGTFRWDIRTNELSWDEALNGLFGLPPGQTVRTLENFLALVHPDERPGVIERCERSVREGADFDMEFRVVWPDGRIRWLHDKGKIVANAAGEPLYMTGACLDVTATRQAKLEREQLERKVQETQKLESLGVLAGGIAHDFNNLLTSILGNASIAAMELPPGSSVQDCLGQINEASMRAAELCKQMLAYSGRGRFVVRRLDLGEVVEQTAQMLQISISKKAVLRFHLEKGLPPVEVDATQIRQVIMNLVINASEAIGDKSGVIRIATGLLHVDRAYLHGTLMDADLPEGDYVALEISDSGCGMSPETQAKIFDPFFTTKFTGRGLGLAAVLGIVRGHKGALKVYSEPGRGTTFKLLFPASRGTSETTKTPAANTAKWRGEGRVLVVDDEEGMRITIARMMGTMGLEPTLASDGREAIELFRADPDRFTLVLLDLTMPHLDGEQTFTELRRIRPDVRVVLMSGFNAHEVLVRFSGKGLASFLQKPFTLEELRTLMRAVLEGNGTPPV